jgi:hypothetical protein
MKVTSWMAQVKKGTVIVPLLVALALTLWPAHLARTDAAVVTGVSPLAVPIHNLWGAPKNEAVEVTLSRTDSAISWSWSRENPQKRPGVSYIQPIYPNARITLKTPVSVGDIQSFNLYADFSYFQKLTGKYNLAFDVFLREKGTSARKAEIMVWLDETLAQPASSFQGTFSDGTNQYKKYWWTCADGAAYRSFLLEGSAAGGREIDLKALVDLIKADKDWYISEVELGTEVWSGSGAAQLNTYYIEVNGEKL